MIDLKSMGLVRVIYTGWKLAQRQRAPPYEDYRGFDNSISLPKFLIETRQSMDLWI